MIRHPAVFSDPILSALDKLLHTYGEPKRVLDPFAGIGRVHELACNSIGVELELEWARQHPQNICADALDLPFKPDSFDAVITSPTYGNRLADHHEARDGTYRLTYRHTLGRPLTANNSGMMQYGNLYREFHFEVYRRLLRVLTDQSFVYLNVGNHIRKREEVDVISFHRRAWERLGYSALDQVEVKTRRHRVGTNSTARIPHEVILVMARVSTTI